MIPRAHRAAGFTLVELVVVLALIGLVLAVVMPDLGAGRETVELRAAASELRALLRSARSNAIAANREILLTIDAGGRGYVLDGTPAAFRSGGFTSGGGLHVEPPARIAFFSTGASSGGRLVVRGRRGEQALEIDGVTGQVALAP